MDVESGVAPGKHVSDDGIVDLALFFQHFQDFVLEGLLKVFGVEARNADERTVGKKAAVRDDGVQARIGAPATKKTISSKITVFYPFHPLHGRELEVDCRPKKGAGSLTIVDPDGVRMKIPSWMTMPQAENYRLTDHAAICPRDPSFPLGTG